MVHVRVFSLAGIFAGNSGLFDRYGVFRWFYHASFPFLNKAGKNDSDSEEKMSESSLKSLGQQVFSAKERVIDWQISQGKKGISKLEPTTPTTTEVPEPDTVTQSHLDRSSIWKKRNRLPPSDILTLIAEEQIAEAMQQGFFNNLKGAGKPFTADDLWLPGKGDLTERLINRMIYKQGFVPDWIESEKEIASDIADLRKDLVKRFGTVLELETAGTVITSIDKNVKDDLLANIVFINSRIDRLNLIVPMLCFQRAHVTLERELNRVKFAVSNNKQTGNDAS